MNIISAFPTTTNFHNSMLKQKKNKMNLNLNLISIFGTVKSVLSHRLWLLIELGESWIRLSQVFAPPRTKSPLDHLKQGAHQFLSIPLFPLNKFPSDAASLAWPGLARLVSAK